MGFIWTLLRIFVAAVTIMTAKDWFDHRSEPITAGEMPVAVKRLIAMEANDYAVYDDYAAHEVPVIENGVRVNVYVPESLLAITPQSAGAIERKLDRNSERGRKVAVHEYDDELELAL